MFGGENRGESRWESNPGHLAYALPLSCDNQTTASRHNHQPSQSSMCNAQVGLKCLSRTPPVAT